MVSREGTTAWSFYVRELLVEYAKVSAGSKLIYLVFLFVIFGWVGGNDSMMMMLVEA